ncbi:MAG: flagellar hook-basal body complex protein FliE [Methanoregulaceae archaeon]|nr:flagellar hook-basal body complex protein FliE [Methanoregulaceae archaeon]
MKVIGVVGLPASGKGEISRIAAGMGIPVVVMGDVIRDAVRAAGLPVTDQNLGGMANALRREGGMAAIAERVLPAIESQQAAAVLVDGIRGDAEVDLFRGRFPEFVLIGVDAPFATRLSRLNARGRSDDVHDADDLSARDAREISWGLGRALTLADYLIMNDGSMEEFEEKARQLLAEITEEPCV